MFKGHRYLPVLLLLFAVAAPACASYGGLYRYPSAARVDNRVYERGYQEGREEGEKDARRNRSFNYSRHDEYRDADEGYRGYGDRNEYRRLYRRGFEAGYNDAYREHSRRGNGSYPPPPLSNRYPDYPVYRGGASVFPSPAANNGLRDGYDQGRDDGRQRRRFDPIGTKRYRSGDRDYDRRYGSIDDYKRDYRAGFQQGYDQGYREVR